MRNIREEIPRCPMLLRWRQTWTDGLPATFQSSCTRNFSEDVGWQPRSRGTVYRSMESSAKSPVRPVIDVKSLFPTSRSTLSPPLSSSPLRYSDPLLKRSRNDLKLDVEYATDPEIAAYFSPRLPSEPMRLVISPPHRHLITDKITAKTSLESCGSSKKIYTNTKSLCEQRSKPDKAQNFVRRLLRSLLQNLPLLDSSEEFSRHMIPACGSTMLLLESETTHRSVSVQAFTVSTEVSVGDSSEITYSDGEREVDPKKKPDYGLWKGGIRALRESHLRLVMRQVRQLRHIARLDRSLKRYKWSQ